jgi:hypothetical protein
LRYLTYIWYQWTEINFSLRYGWSAKLAVNIITDFEESELYDCTVKPQSTNAASGAGRHKGFVVTL